MKGLAIGIALIVPLMIAIDIDSTSPAAELACKQAAPLMVKYCANNGGNPCVIAYEGGYAKVDIRRAGWLTSLSIEGDFSGTIEDGGADGIVDKTTGGGLFGGRYDSSRHNGNFSEAQKKYEEECKKLLPALKSQ